MGHLAHRGESRLVEYRFANRVVAIIIHEFVISLAHDRKSERLEYIDDATKW